MSRLTFYDDFGKPCYRIKQYSEVHGGYVDAVISDSDVVRKLAEYEDAEEQGLIVNLPEAETVMALIVWYFLHNGSVHSVTPNNAMRPVLKFGVRQFYSTWKEAKAALKEAVNESKDM